MSEKAIVVESLEFAYEKTTVLENVGFSIKKGEFVGIIGPNGGGKTTLLKLIMGFLKPDRGEILLFGSSPKNERKRMGYVPQTNAFDKYFPITVVELVLMGSITKSLWFGAYPKEMKERALALLEKLQLSSYKDKTFGSLSGGLAQRALIARALLSDPDLILLDEPTASIDPETRQKIFDLIDEMKGKKTILMVTHDLKTAIEKVERVLCVERTVNSLKAQEICEHFALGLYHSPLVGIKR